MRILYLSDFNCPYSYIGLKRITDVAEDLGLDAEWEMRAFELEIDADNCRAVDRLAVRNGLSMEDAIREADEIERIARDEGLNISYREMSVKSSMDAHRLVRHVQDRCPEASLELVLKIFEANFIKGEDISDHDVLTGIAASCGLDGEEMAEFLKRDSLKIEIFLDMDEAVSNGITTIPYYFLEHDNERLIVPGVFERESFRVAFDDLLSGRIRDKTFI